MSERGDDHEWPVRESVAEYETGWYTGGYDLVAQPDGTEKKYYWAALAPAVVVVPVHEGDLLFVDQYRPTVRRQCLELPAGIVEKEGSADAGAEDGTGREVESGAGTGIGAGDGAEERARGRPEADRETYAAAAARELREETGFEPDRVRFLADFWCATGVLRHRRGIVYADGLSRVGRDLDDNEFLTVERVPADEAFEHAAAAPANDATLEGLLLAEREGYL